MPSPKLPSQLVLVQDAPTRVSGRSYILNAGKWVKLPGGIVGRHRKQIVITNEDNSDKAHIVVGADGNVDPDTADEKLMSLFPNTSITLFTSADILIKNLNPVNNVDAIQVLEVFYV